MPNNYLTEDLVILDEEEFQKAISSPYGRFPSERDISSHINNGLIILDKHAGPTSHEVVSIVKNILKINKAGHSGTLDPGVTGVLPIALENATKVLYTLLTSPKGYVCHLHTNKPLQANAWISIFDYFTDEIYQVPPKKSNVAKRLRKRRIYELDFLEAEKNSALFRVTCQAGTYIRTLCEDIGRTYGANSYMKELRRIKTGPFFEKDTVTLYNLFDAYEDWQDGLGEEKIRKVIQPIERAIIHIPTIVLRENAIDPICHGSDLMVPGVLALNDFNPGDLVALRSPKGEIIAIGKSLMSSNTVTTRLSGVVCHPEKVLMPRKIYPSYTPG